MEKVEEFKLVVENQKEEKGSKLKREAEKLKAIARYKSGSYYNGFGETPELYDNRDEIKDA